MNLFKVINYENSRVNLKNIEIFILISMFIYLFIYVYVPIPMFVFFQVKCIVQRRAAL